MRTRLVTASSILLIAAACGGSGGNPLNPTPSGPASGETTQPVSTAGTATTNAAGGPNTPVPIQQGLGTFDAYVFVANFVSTGPEPDQRSETTIRTEFDRASDSRIVVTDTFESGPDLDEPAESHQRVLTVGNETCTDDGESWTYDSSTPQEREILDLALGQVDMVVTPESPVEIGRGDFAGIPAINYSFTPAGLGSESGAVTDVSLAEYWVSVDGNVLLRYDLVAESRDGPTDDPNTTAFFVEIHLELVDTTGPGVVTLPTECLATQE